VRGRHVVGDTRDGGELRRVLHGLLDDEKQTSVCVGSVMMEREKARQRWAHLPDTEELDEEVVGEAREEHLGDEEDVGRQRALEHDGHVGGVEELDGEVDRVPLEARVLDGDLDPEALEVDDGRKDGDGRDEVHDVWHLVPVEGLLDRPGLVVHREEVVEESDDGALELGPSTGVDGRGRKGLPDDGLANVGSDEEGDSRAETVALLEELVEEKDDEGGGDELEDKEEADSGTEVGGLAVESGEDVDGGLTKGDDEGKDWWVRAIRGEAGDGQGGGRRVRTGREGKLKLISTSSSTRSRRC
jgi:hypothetical protein